MFRFARSVVKFALPSPGSVFLRLCRHSGELESLRFAVHLGAAVDVGDSARVEKSYPLLIELGVFEKELPLLGKIDLEAGQIDLFLIRLDGGEVGIQCQYSRYAL